MTETTVGREPVQLVEMNLPKCANSYGCGMCTAGVGDVDTTSGLSENFRTTRTADNWSTTDASLGVNVSGRPFLRVDATGASPRFYQTGATGFAGDDFRYIVIHGKCVTPGTPLFTAWYGTVDAARSMQAVNFSQRFRGATLETIKAGQEFVAVFDAADSTNYATDWQGQTVTDMQFGLSDDDGSEYEVYSIQVCNSNLFAARGGECFNTFSTCQDVDAYQDNPLQNSDPTAVYSQGDVVPYADIDKTGGKVAFQIRVNIPMEPEGELFSLGDSPGFSISFTDAYPFIDGYALLVSLGGASPDRIQSYADINAYLGKTIILSLQFDGSEYMFTSIYDPVTGADEYVGAFAAEPPSGAIPTPWASDDDGAVGDGFNGTIDYVRYIEDSPFPIFAEGEFRSKLYFGWAQQAKPRDDIRIRPMLKDAATVASNINVSTFDRNYSPLGSRASASVQMLDAVSTDRGVDPYYTDRTYDVTDGTRGLFWERMRPRHKIGIYGATLNIYDGYAGQYLSEMLTRRYLADEVTWGFGDAVTIKSRDVLTLADPETARYPTLSTGELSLDINDSILSMTTTGHTLDEYPASGTVRIGDELITYSAIVDNLDDTFDWTLTARGTDGSEAEEHSQGDTVQKCERFTSATVYEALLRVLGEGTEIEYQYFDLTGWQNVNDFDLPAYRLSTLLSEPTSVSVLAGEIARDCGFYLWWDERDSLIKIRAITSLRENPTVITDDDNLIAGSITYKEKPSERISELWISYNPKNFADLSTVADRDDVSKYRNNYVRAINAGYKVNKIRVIYSRWLTASADVFETQSRIARQYAEIPTSITFRLDAKDRALWVGDAIRVTNNRVRDENGLAESRLYVVTSANEVASGDQLQYTAQDTTLSGQAWLIAPDSQPDYTGDPSTDGIYMFISDEDGLMSDGTEGATIT